MSITTAQISSPIGPVAITVVEGALTSLRFASCASAGDSRHPIADRVAAWFAGDLEALDEIAVEPGGTPFFREVWSALRRIPSGTTTSYGELARIVGRPRAVRAVGAANAKNPIAIVIPCHRVLAKDGSLHGYEYGLERKRWLLDHEQPRSIFGRHGASAVADTGRDDLR